MDPVENNAPQSPTPPSSNTGFGLPPASGQDSELYNQIAGQDVDVPVVKKKGPSLLVTIMALVMRFTLWLDSMKRTHERFFRALGVIWTIFMALLYFSGVLMLIFAIYNRLQLPIYLEDQLRARDVEFETAEYGMDRIIVRNLKDKANTYTVDTMVIYSTFTDLLQKRIRLVTLDGLNIFVDTKANFNVFKDVPQLLRQIQNPTRGRLDIAVNALTINNAKITFKDRQVEIPVSFSMEGMYGDETQIVLPLSINQPSLQAKATLTIDGSGYDPEWVLSVSEGVITLPRSAPENIVGNLKVALSGNELAGMTADFKLSYGTIEKHITANFNKGDTESLFGEIIWAKNNLTEQNLSSEVSFKISNLTLENTSDLKITGPTVVNAKQLVLTNAGITGMQVPLNADIICKDWARCFVSLKDPAIVTIQDMWLQYQRQTIHSKDTIQFSLLPQERAFVVQEENPYIGYQLPIKNFTFDGVVEGSNTKLFIEADSLTVSGALADESAEASRFSVDAKGMTYEAADISMKKANVVASNLLQNSSNVQIQADEMQLTSVPLLSHPFSLNMNMVGSKAAARLNFKDNPISIQLDGQLSLAQRSFVGQIRTNVIDLEQLTVPLQTLFPEVPASFTGFSGSVMAYGQLKWVGPHSIGGPLNLGLKDVSFTSDNTKVSGVNTVLTLDSIQPLVAKKNQHVYISSIDGLLPFQDIDILLQADNQNWRVNQCSVIAAGIPLSLPPSVIAQKNANMLIYLKNDRPIDMKQLQNSLNVPGLEISSGTANLAVPIEIQNNKLTIPNATLKAQGVLVQRKSDDYSAVFETSDNYYIRTGQIIMDKNKVLQLAFNGRLLPSKKAKDVQENDVALPDDVFKAVSPKGVPQDIQKRQHVLFGD